MQFLKTKNKTKKLILSGLCWYEEASVYIKAKLGLEYP